MGRSETHVSAEEAETKKKAIFDSMGTRGQKRILRNGYENWDPFEEPKEPLDIRTDISQRTTQDLVREFLQSANHEEYSTQYGAAVLDMAIGLMNNIDTQRACFEFSIWYNELLIKEGHKKE